MNKQKIGVLFNHSVLTHCQKTRKKFEFMFCSIMEPIPFCKLGAISYANLHIDLFKSSNSDNAGLMSSILYILSSEVR